MIIYVSFLLGNGLQMVSSCSGMTPFHRRLRSTIGHSHSIAKECLPENRKVHEDLLFRRENASRADIHPASQARDGHTGIQLPVCLDTFSPPFILLMVCSKEQIEHEPFHVAGEMTRALFPERGHLTQNLRFN